MYCIEAQAAKKLGISPGTLRNWRWRKYGPSYEKVGKRIEYLESDIEDWRRAQRRDPSSAA